MSARPVATRHRPVATDPARRALLSRRVRSFVAATIGYNIIEATVALAAGAAASSTALISFGLDSIIEVSSAAVVAWQFSARDPRVREAREHRALRLIAILFFALAAYVTVESVRSLAGGGTAESSRTGIVLAVLSLLLMPALSYAQRRAGRELGSASAVADSKQTLLCSYLSGVLLLGLGLNALLGWAIADPLAALVIAGIAVKEGIVAWRGDTCCAAIDLADPASPAATPCACGAACARCDPHAPDEPSPDQPRVTTATARGARPRDPAAG